MVLSQFFRILLLAGFSAIFSFSWSQKEEGAYMRMKISADQDQVDALGRAGVAVDHVEHFEGGIIGEFSPWERRQIRQLGLSTEVLIPDVSQNYVTRNQQAGMRVSGTQRAPHGFNLGSMGGHLTYQEAVEEMDSMRLLYPNLVSSKDSIGTSVEGRPIWMVKISNAPGLNEAEPEVLYVGLHHAREPMSLMNLVYFMYYLLENYGTDPTVTYLVDNRELYFVPILNPDGYVFNQMTHPNGGGMWRKNRQAYGSSVVGVDLNRNYGYAWSFDNVGSSSDPNAQTYRGTAPFSEPETAALRQFCAQHEIRTALNYHAWGNTMINPWGFDRSAALSDLDRFHQYGSFMTESNEYLVGNPFQTLGYAANGTSDDWMYGDITDKPRIMAFTPEVGGVNDWFWPMTSRILPLCEAQVQANLRIACLAGECIDTRPEVPCELEGPVARLPMRFANFGLAAGSGFASFFTSLDANITSVPISQLNVPAMAAGQEVVDSFAIVLAPNIPAGTIIRGLVRTVLPNNIILRDTIEFAYGAREIIFAENGERNLSNWTGAWSKTVEKSYSGNYSITDSPQALYNSLTNSAMTLIAPLNLRNYTDIQLRFRATWELERGWDYVEVSASDDGINFTPLSGTHTRLGNGMHQPNGKPLFDGAEYEWVLEKMDLSSYAGGDVFLRFRLVSNSSQERDGFFFDDLVVSGRKIATSPSPSWETKALYLFPNPGEGHFRVGGGQKGLEMQTLTIFSALGTKVYQEAIEPGQLLDLTFLPAGVYVYSFHNSTLSGQVQKLILR